MNRLFALVILFALASCEQPPKPDATAQSGDDLPSSLRRQVESHWEYNPGLPGIDKSTVTIALEMNPDGSVKSASIIDDLPRMKNDDNYRAFAESALRAVMRSSPLKIPPSVPYEVWKRIVIDFRVMP